MKIGRLRIKLHFFKPSRTYGKYHLSDWFGIIKANTFNTQGCIISFLFFIHIFIDWWMRDGNPNEHYERLRK